MKVEEFDELPLLVRAAEACAVLGVERESLRALRAAHPEIAQQVLGKGEWRYRKRELARLAGVECR